MVRLGGVEVPGRGKGSHRSVLMPNGFTAVFPSGKLKTGLLADQLKGSDVTVEAFSGALYEEDHEVHGPGVRSGAGRGRVLG